MSKAKTGKGTKQNLLDTINSDDALQILRTIYAEDKRIAGKIERVANKYLSDVDIDQIAEEVFSELDDLEVEELWDRSGPHHDGYSEPGEMAYEMAEEVLEPYLADMKKYQKLVKSKEAKLCCMGILKGIGRYEKESRSEFKSWLGDGLWECWGGVLQEWEKSAQSLEERKEMKDFIKSHFPEAGK